MEPVRYIQSGYADCEPLESAEGDEPSKDSTGNGDDDTLKQQLPQDARFTGADRQADGHFTRPSRAAGEQHISDVRAGDQQDESDSGEQDGEDGSQAVDAVDF